MQLFHQKCISQSSSINPSLCHLHTSRVWLSNVGWYSWRISDHQYNIRFMKTLSIAVQARWTPTQLELAFLHINGVQRTLNLVNSVLISDHNRRQNSHLRGHRSCVRHNNTLQGFSILTSYDIVNPDRREIWQVTNDKQHVLWKIEVDKSLQTLSV